MAMSRCFMQPIITRFQLAGQVTLYGNDGAGAKCGESNCSTGFQPVACVLAPYRVSETDASMIRLRDCGPEYRHDTGWKPVLQPTFNRSRQIPKILSGQCDGFPFDRSPPHVVAVFGQVDAHQ